MAVSALVKDVSYTGGTNVHYVQNVGILCFYHRTLVKMMRFTVKIITTVNKECFTINGENVSKL